MHFEITLNDNDKPGWSIKYPCLYQQQRGSEEAQALRSCLEAARAIALAAHSGAGLCAAARLRAPARLLRSAEALARSAAAALVEDQRARGDLFRPQDGAAKRALPGPHRLRAQRRLRLRRWRQRARWSSGLRESGVRIESLIRPQLPQMIRMTPCSSEVASAWRWRAWLPVPSSTGPRWFS